MRAAREEARHFAVFWCAQAEQPAGRLVFTAAAVASTLGRTCGCGQAQVPSLLLLLLCFPMKEVVVRRFTEISC